MAPTHFIHLLLYVIIITFLYTYEHMMLIPEDEVFCQHLTTMHK